MIVVVSHPEDDHATRVLAALSARQHPAALVDTGRFPAQAILTQRFGTADRGVRLVVGGEDVDLAEARVGWWRRPRPFALHEGIDPDVASFAYSECHEAMMGALAALGLAWVNPPALDEAAHHKPFQLQVATEVGLRVPRTLITNEPGAAVDFHRQNGPGRTVYKTFLATEEHWRETRILQPDEIGMLDTVAYAPVIFQEFVPAVADIRATVLGETVIAAAITPAPQGYAYDYRMDMAGARFEPTTVRPDTQQALLALMRRLGIVYGAVDLRRTPEGEEVFLEVNPAGEWLFVEERTGQPITEAMADLLVSMDGGP
jgi:glutathione synthase/RimK-type ligase-like ATP-grasp enzyme